MVLGYRESGENVGEHVGIIVVPEDDAIAQKEAEEKTKYTESQIRALLSSEVKRLAEGLAPYKRPRRIQYRWEEFNKTDTGKIKRYLYAMDTAEV